MQKETVTVRTLADMVKDLHDLLAVKDELADQTKENNAAIEAAKQEIIQQMVDDDCSSIGCQGYNYSLQHKIKYNKKSDADLAEAGIDFLETLRDEGLGDIIVETVNAQTLSTTIKNYIEENGELTEGLESIINPYEFDDIGRRKIPKKMGRAK